MEATSQSLGVGPNLEGSGALPPWSSNRPGQPAAGRSSWESKGDPLETTGDRACCGSIRWIDRQVRRFPLPRHRPQGGSRYGRKSNAHRDSTRESDQSGCRLWRSVPPGSRPRQALPPISGGDPCQGSGQRETSMRPACSGRSRDRVGADPAIPTRRGVAARFTTDVR